VTLTLSLAYLTVLAHQRNRERQSAILRANTTVISGLTDPLPPVHLPTRSEIAARQRENFVELAKDRWNAEVEGAVRWAQETDWHEVRVGAETAVGRLWAKAFGNAIEEAEKGEKKAGVLAGQAKEEVKREATSALAKTKSVASEKAGGVAAAAKSAYADAKVRGTEAVEKSEQKAEAAKGSIFSAVGRGIEKGKEALGIVKDKAIGAEQKLEGKIDAKLSPVERTLQQRYEKPSGVNQTVEQALAERYTPIDKRDNAVLRGV
jgi:altered-inheritance-of-mitochondria protein 5